MNKIFEASYVPVSARYSQDYVNGAVIKTDPQTLENIKNDGLLQLTNNEVTTAAIRINEFRTKGNAANFISKPYILANKIKDPFKKIRNLAIFILLDAPEFINEFKKSLLADGYSGIEANKLLAICGEQSGGALAKINQEIEWLKDTSKPFIKEAVEKTTDLEEDIEKHDELNPKLFNPDGILKDEVREKILAIVDNFTESLDEDGIKIIIKDIVLIGSNASYNYTKDSDLDIHIIADTSSLHCPDNLYPALYSAYRSLFNKKFDIDFYGIPVELYVETENVSTVSNGIYSVKENSWIKEPVQTDIPELDTEAFDAEFEKWRSRCQEIINNTSDKLIPAEKAQNEIINFIEDIYDLRKSSIKEDGEYSIGNLIFKEIRNRGMLDKLKELRDEVMAQMLSLESLNERLDERKRREYHDIIWRTVHNQPVIQNNNYFTLYQVKESEVDSTIKKLKALPFVKSARRGAAGGYDFSRVLPGKLPQRKFTIVGELKED